MTIEISAAAHKNLIRYAEVLERESGQKISDPKKLIAPMLVKFMETDRAFLKAKRANLIIDILGKENVESSI
jgi:hypothetical protein